MPSPASEAPIVNRPKGASGTVAKHRTGTSPAEGMRMTFLATARRRQTITYGALMERFGLSRGKALSSMIGTVDRRESASGAPGFAALIVRKDTGYPGGGYFCDEELPPTLRRPRSRGSDPRLSRSEKEHIEKQQSRIWKYYGAPPRQQHGAAISRRARDS